MKKVILVMLVALSAIAMNAQGFKFGLTAGLNVSNWSGDVEDVKWKPGFQAGVVADYALTESFSITPELLFSQRGTKVEEGDATVNFTLNYLQLPINATYKIALPYDSKFLVFAGPYVGYGLSTSAKAKAGKTSVTVDDAIKFGSKDDEINPFDFGLNIGVGYQFEKIFFKLQYNLGLANLNNDGNGSVKNNNVAVSVGYFF